MSWSTETLHPDSRSTAPFRLFAVLGLVALALAAALEAATIWPALLFDGVFLLGLGVGALYFLAISSVSGAGWMAAIKRAPEAMTALVPVGGIVVLVAIAGGASALYPWMGEHRHGLGPFKSWWLDPPFFYGRSLVYVGVLSLFAWAFRTVSRRQDANRETQLTIRHRRLSAAFLFFGSFTVLFLSVDWLMSLEPHWTSTMYGVYHFAGLFQTSLAALLLLLIWLRRGGHFGGAMNSSHLHDVAKFLFGMSTFWIYIWYSQYVLIWYTNIPEETVYFSSRMVGAWRVLFWASPILNWVLPFHLLMPWKAKHSEKVVGRVALLVLAGRLLDLYLMIYPPIAGSPRVGLAELGGLLLLIGLPLLVVVRTLRGAPLVSTGDPFIAESLHHHT